MANLENKNLIIVMLLIVCGILAGGLIYSQLWQKSEGNVVSPDEAARLGLAFINESLLVGQIEATLTGEIVEEGSLYKFQIEIGEEKIFSYITKDGKTLFPQGIDLGESLQQETGEKAEERSTTVGNFLVSGDEICTKDNKPIVYFFGSETCPYCTWEHPIMERVAEKFTDYISFHNNMDTDADMDIFSKYSLEGYVPALVLGCKYYRVGAGTQSGEEQETKDLTALICKLTDSQPADVCQQVEDLINQIK